MIKVKINVQDSITVRISSVLVASGRFPARALHARCSLRAARCAVRCSLSFACMHGGGSRGMQPNCSDAVRSLFVTVPFCWEALRASARCEKGQPSGPWLAAVLLHLQRALFALLFANCSQAVPTRVIPPGPLPAVAAFPLVLAVFVPKTTFLSIFPMQVFKIMVRVLQDASFSK